MSALIRFERWWQSLDSAERQDVFSVADLLPEWIVSGLRSAGIVTVPVLMPGPTVGQLMTTGLREFVDAKRESDEMLDIVKP